MVQLLVFGKSGQVATSLQALSADGTTKIDCIGRPDGDITNFEKVVSSIKAFNPDIVVNAAAYTAVDKAETDSDAAHKINAIGAENIAKATAQAEIPIIHISTDYVFSGDKKQPYYETDKPDPKGVYGASKLAGENMVVRQNQNHIILRTAWVYSAIGNNFVKTMLRLAKDRDVLTVVDDQYGNPTHASDIARAIIFAAKQIKADKDFANYGYYNFCGPERMSWADFANRIFNISTQLGGPGLSVNKIPSSQYPTPAKRPKNSSLNCEKFCSTFKFNRSLVDHSLRQVIKILLEKS